MESRRSGCFDWFGGIQLDIRISSFGTKQKRTSEEPDTNWDGTQEIWLGGHCPWSGRSRHISAR